MKSLQNQFVKTARSSSRSMLISLPNESLCTSPMSTSMPALSLEVQAVMRQFEFVFRKKSGSSVDCCPSSRHLRCASPHSAFVLYSFQMASFTMDLPVVWIFADRFTRFKPCEMIWFTIDLLSSLPHRKLKPPLGSAIMTSPPEPAIRHKLAKPLQIIRHKL